MGLSGSDDEKFLDSLPEGSAYKDIVKVMLQKSGYTIYNYGHEGPFADIKSKLTKTARYSDSRTGRRIRSSPDFLVYDDQKNDLMLVEVMMRGSVPPKIKPRLVKTYKEFWNDLILVLVVPEDNVFDNVFYAQRISEVESIPVYDRMEDFEKFQDVFTRVGIETISHFKSIVLQNMRA
jgi:hypothetical protein